MDARRLLSWGDLEEQRRRAARLGLGRLSPWLYTAVAAGVMALVVGRTMVVFGRDVAGQSRPLDGANLWLAVLAAGHAIALMGAPFRMYWRHDSALIGRMAITGRAIFAVAWIRSARAAAKVALPCAAGALMFGLGPYGSWDIAARHLALVGIAFAWAALLGPAVALAAGAVVASDRARSALRSLTGEFEPPRTAWLGLLPGLSATGLVLVVIGCTTWARGGVTAPVGQPIHLLALGALLPLAAGALAMARADRVMLGAVREVAALDQERLAHVELTRPSPLERAVGKLLGSAGARLMLEKDASLSRRRFPIPFFLGVVGVATLWILAAAASADLLLWAGTVCAGLGAYGLVMARRYVSPPIEHVTFVRTLPIAPRDRVRAKRAHLTLWIVGYMVLGALPVVARAADALTAAGVFGAIIAVTWLAGSGITSRA